jgi:hypothetical protein
MAFSAVSTAFEGFRVIGHRPGTVALWGLFYLGVVLAMIVVLFALTGTTLIDSLKHVGSKPDTEAILRIAGGLMLAWVVNFGVLVLGETMFCAAVFRAVLRPEQKRLGYLRFGGDELRLLLVFLVTGALWCVAFVMAGMVVSLFIGLAYSGNRSVGAALGYVSSAVVACGLIWLGVKMSMAPVMTFAEGRIRIFESFGLTRGHFRKLLGMYAVVALVCAALWVAMSLIIYLFEFLGLGGLLATGAIDNTLDGLFKGIGVFILIMMAAAVVCLEVVMLMRLIVYAPQAAAYRQLMAAGADPAPAPFAPPPEPQITAETV